MEVYMFIRWGAWYIGEDAVKELVSRLTSEFDISVVENGRGDIIIKGDGIVGYFAKKGYVSTRLREDTEKWLIEKCKEGRDAEHAISNIMFHVYGKLVSCGELEKFLKEGGEYSAVVGAIVNVRSDDAKLIKVISEYLGAPNLVRPY
jgi:hypothetical protein